MNHIITVGGFVVTFLFYQLLYAFIFRFLNIRIWSTQFDSWIMAIIFMGSIVFHELGHLMASKVFGRKIKRVEFSVFVAKVIPDPNSRIVALAEWVIISFAGPAANLVLTLIGAGLWITEISFEVGLIMSLLNLTLAISNLIPFPHSDGAHIRTALSLLP